MIKFLVLVNKQGQTRLARYYEDLVDVTGEERAVQVRRAAAAAGAARTHCCASPTAARRRLAACRAAVVTPRVLCLHDRTAAQEADIVRKCLMRGEQQVLARGAALVSLAGGHAPPRLTCARRCDPAVLLLRVPRLQDCVSTLRLSVFCRRRRRRRE